MAASEPKPGGIIDSVRRVGETALALLHTRLRLLSVELQEEKYRAIQALLWLCGGVILVFLGLALGVATLALLTYCQWGIPGLAGLALLVLVVGVIVLAVMWNRFKSGGLPFAGTLEELRKDGEWLRRKH